MTTPPLSTPKPALDKYGINAIARHVSQPILIGALMFIGAGTTDWAWAWVYNIVHVICWIALSAVLVNQNPGLLNQRGKRMKDMSGTKRWDWFLVFTYFALLLITPFVAGLDYRYGWSAPVSPAINVLGIVLLIAGFVPLTWAMAANKFFEVTVRIQTEKGQQVAATGPYKIVRHPGYVGAMLHFLAVPLAVGAWAALIPALIGLVVFVVRTALEDNALHNELPGYAEYARQTRFRLLPGVW